MTYRMNADDLINIINSKQEQNQYVEKNIDFELGNNRFIIEEELINSEIKISKNLYYINDDELILNCKENQEILELHFNLSLNGIGYKNHFLDSEKVSSMTGNLIHIGATDEKSDIYFEKKSEYKTFDIHFSKNVFLKYYGENKKLDNFIKHISDGKSLGYTNNEIYITPPILCAIQDINSCQYQGLTRKIYIESKIYEILAHTLENHSNEKQPKISNRDKEIVHLAASLINENIKKPLTIEEISKRVGINQTKLKKLFKEIFGCTIFTYLQTIRMNNAKTYITDSELTIDEISQLSGYTSISNFSAAFKKHFGFSPSKLK
ncbi:helix-turn-helix transcriptional regulator [Chryseobacterium oryctis]|uniref:AraC family transcriptional regulator n=1 Tax=Chryseobacterium oryctis TaxID=2952618 RepID=A0ABT3HKV9_9FLAO|nr:helix-turn-helix domain-containing protein [Chryseobacterium oryctis]MCW3160300.1 AraC family transcriptional regulator [Chryseobacterium oryctis]